MSESSYAITALIAKRAEVAGLILDLERQAEQNRKLILHIDATLKALDPEIKLHTIRVKHRAAERSSYFAPGEIAGRCRDLLREAGARGITADDVTVKAMDDKGVGPGDEKIRRDFLKRFHWTLGRLVTNGDVVRIGYGKGVKWRLRDLEE